MQEVEITLNPKQAEVDTATEREIFYISGVGGGKSFELGQWVLERASIKGTVGLLAAPTHDVMRQSTFPQVKESLEKVKVIEDVHYVVNKTPPPQWGVPSFSSLGNHRIITFAWGSYLVVDTLDNVNKARGSQYDYIAVDEFRDVKFSDVRIVLLGRLRGRKFKEIGRQHQILWASTPPDNTTELNELLSKTKGIRLVEGTSFDNKKNLPDNYIENLEETYDPLTAQREIYGSRVSSTKGQPFFYCFEEKHISDKAVHISGLTVYLSFDFNVNPVTCIMAHIGTLNLKPFVHVFDEIGLFNEDIDELCRQIKSRYPNEHFIVTGDASGRSRTALGKNLNYYISIKKQLELKDAQFKLPGKNPSYAENIVLCNSVLAKHNEILINSKCKELIYDMRFVQWDGEKIVKDDRSKKAQKADYADCFRYFLNSFLHTFVKKN